MDFEIRLCKTPKKVSFFINLVFTNEGSDGIDILKSSMTMHPNYTLEVASESLLALTVHKAGLKAVTSKKSRSCTLVLCVDTLRVSESPCQNMNMVLGRFGRNKT